ncbi:hypothetical protein Tco_0396156, partial [Tanacetum coccineum]
IVTFGEHLSSPPQESLHQLKGIAMRFEEKCYTSATSHFFFGGITIPMRKSDYMRKITLKLMAIREKNTSANPVPGSLPSNAAVNPSDSGDIKVSKKINYMVVHMGSGANGSASDKAPGQVSAARTLEILKKMLKQHTDALEMFKEDEMKFEAAANNSLRPSQT